MRNLALLDLRQRFKAYDIVGMSELRNKFGAEFAPMLVEDAGKIPRVYVLREVLDKPGHVKMWVEELDEVKERRLPFKQQREKAIRPIVKRTFSRQKGAGPTITTQENTITDLVNIHLTMVPNRPSTGQFLRNWTLLFMLVDIFNS